MSDLIPRDTFQEDFYKVFENGYKSYRTRFYRLTKCLTVWDMIIEVLSVFPELSHKSLLLYAKNIELYFKRVENKNPFLLLINDLLKIER